MSLWRFEELEQALRTGATAKSQPAASALSGVSIDSRTLRAGDLFIALSGNPGHRFRTSSTSARDGHDFVQAAVEAGAAALLVAREVETTVPTFRVADTLEALWSLARLAVRRAPARRIAITGSSGKTTARAFLEALLKDVGRVHASEGSLNNHWGVPLSLARMPRESEFAILEVGTNHAGEVAPLAQLVAPEVALLLNVAPAHLGMFSGLDAIRREKLSIASALGRDGVLVVPHELDLAGIAPHRILTFGRSPEADVFCRDIDVAEGWHVHAVARGRPLQFSLAEGGAHRVETALAVIAVLCALGIDPAGAEEVLSGVVSPAGRGNRHVIGGVTVVDDSYNANPSSMSHALELLATSGAARRIAILGDMLELGDASAALHRDLAAHCAHIDRLLLVGPMMRHLYDALPRARRWRHVERCEEIDVAKLVEELDADDEVLVKGSNRIFWIHHFVRDLLAALSRSRSDR